MTKMPEPVAYYDEGGLLIEPSVSMVNDDPRLKGLITTTQAEAYANERVKEALEEAARLIDPYNEEGTLGAINAKSILSLTPKE